MQLSDVCLSIHRCVCVEKKNQLDVTECFIALMIRSTKFCTSKPIIRSSKQYVCYYRLWCAVLCCWLAGVRCRAAGCESRKRDAAHCAAFLFLDSQPAALYLTTSNHALHTIGGNNTHTHTHSLELLMMGMEVTETCWAYHKCNKAFSDISWFFFSTHMVFNKFRLMPRLNCTRLQSALTGRSGWARVFPEATM
jgi:hypothetical protein